MKLITLTEDELNALAGESPDVFKFYVMLRARMDFSTGLVGAEKGGGVSWQGLREDMYVEPRAGRQSHGSPTEKYVRDKAARLVELGLLESRTSYRRLVFLMPMAHVAESRSNLIGQTWGRQAGQEVGQTQSHDGQGFQHAIGQEVGQTKSSLMGHTSGIRVNPISVVEVEGNVTRARDPVSAPGSLPSSDASPTRLGLLCRQLRLQGVDAAPHLLAQPAWESILQRCSDEAILGAAELARAKKPGCRIHLNYLIPILNQPPPQPGDDPPDARRRRDKQVEREAFFNELGVGNGSRSQTGRVIDLAAKRVG